MRHRDVCNLLCHTQQMITWTRENAEIAQHQQSVSPAGGQMDVYYVLSTKTSEGKVVFIEGFRRESFVKNKDCFSKIQLIALEKNNMISKDDQSLAISGLPAVEYQFSAFRKSFPHIQLSSPDNSSWKLETVHLCHPILLCYLTYKKAFVC